MKVYTHFKRINDVVGLRWRTILQFGDSWNIIGSIVMKNPGTSNIKNAQIVHKPELDRFDTDNNEWYEFSVDATMNKIGDLFSFYYGTRLNGVIQIFNLFYIREGDLDKAIQLDSSFRKLVSQEETLNSDLAFLSETPCECPIYLGFSSLAWNETYAERARAFFDITVKHYGDKGCYLNLDYNKNPFYHPLYLMCYGRNRINCIKQLYAFKQNASEPALPDDLVLNIPSKLQKAIVNDITNEIFVQFKESLYENKRLKNNSFLSVTLHDGKVLVRPVDYLQYRMGKYYKSCEETEKAVEILNELNFNTCLCESDSVWLGSKDFEDYGTDKEIIKQGIIYDIKSIISVH